jgi:hypothetical protein
MFLVHKNEFHAKQALGKRLKDTFLRPGHKRSTWIACKMGVDTQVWGMQQLDVIGQSQENADEF